MPRTWAGSTPQTQLLVDVGGLAIAFAFVIVGLATFLSFTWPSAASKESMVNLGTESKFVVGEPVWIEGGRRATDFWLVKQEDERYLALSPYNLRAQIRRVPHYDACFRLEWQPEYNPSALGFVIGPEPETIGWFRDPCDLQFFDRAGNCYFSCYRGMDRYEVEIVNGNVIVDISKRIPGPRR